LIKTGKTAYKEEEEEEEEKQFYFIGNLKNEIFY
jgi:hypothetical protein